MGFFYFLYLGIVDQIPDYHFKAKDMPKNLKPEFKVNFMQAHAFLACLTKMEPSIGNSLWSIDTYLIYLTKIYD